MYREINERLTRVGPGTLAGEMLRRYWWPGGSPLGVIRETPGEVITLDAGKNFGEKNAKAGASPPTNLVMTP